MVFRLSMRGPFSFVRLSQVYLFFGPRCCLRWSGYPFLNPNLFGSLFPILRVRRLILKLFVQRATARRRDLPHILSHGLFVENALNSSFFTQFFFSAAFSRRCRKTAAPLPLGSSRAFYRPCLKHESSSSRHFLLAGQLSSRHAFF